MNRYLKAVFCLAFLVLAMEVHVPLVLCQDEAQVFLAKSVSGAIVSIDKEKSMVVVAAKKETKDEMSKLEDVSVQVVDSTTIEKNQKSASLSDLSSGEKVEVSYTTDQSGKNIAKSIVVEAGQQKSV